MIDKLELSGLTIFAQEYSFSFVPGLNVIIGGNASGKSHLLKLAFTVSKWTRRLARQELDACLEAGLARDVERVFGSSSLDGLISYQSPDAEVRVRAAFSDASRLAVVWDAEGLSFELSPEAAVFSPVEGSLIPPREVLSVYPSFAQVGRRYPDLMDGASWELCCALEQVPTQSASPAMQAVKAQIDALLGGVISRDKGRFYLKLFEGRSVELGLIAEGFKRLGTLALLLENGKIAPGHMLCWDEAEMNLNICHLPALVSIILDLCAAGVQVMLTTHSLFLLRELHLRLAEAGYQGIPSRFIVLEPQVELGQGLQVHSADCLDALPILPSLKAELEQADRYLTKSL